jgi:Cu(I)/Ag(I) efflux system membrane fusion protein
MHPQIVRDEPGSCPICGMDLVAVTEEAAEMDSAGAPAPPAVSIAPGIRQSLGLRTAKAEVRDLHIEIRTPGSVDYDETRMTHIHPRAAGWFEKLHVRAAGDPVKAGEILGEFYSPEILAAQVDFLVALDSSQRGKLDSARNGLRLLGVPEKTIQQIETQRKTLNRVPVIAPASGIITNLGTREGMYVMPASETFAITDLDRVWVKADVYEHQIAALQTGLEAEIRLPAWPERVWQGAVEYIYPQLNAASRTLSLRLGFDNPEHLLKPGMFAEAVIKAQPKKAAVVIPQQALIITGERQAVVKVVADGRFQPVDVVPGITRDGMTEIISGIAAGDEVVVSGQFLIDSESALQASFQRLSGE